METKGKGKEGKRRPKRLPAEVQAMVDGGRMLYSIMAAIISAVVEADGSGELIRRLDQPEGKPLIHQIAELIVGKVAAPIIWVTWEMVLAWVIAACRFVISVNPNITGTNFPFASGDLDLTEVIIVPIKEAMSAEQILKMLDEKGLRPARLMNLLWWWLTHPAKQANYLVVAFGSVWRGGVPYISSSGGVSSLFLGPVDGRWDSNFTFAAVCKAA